MSQWNGVSNMLDVTTTQIPNSTRENGTLDVMRKGCFNDFNAIACVRNGLMVFVAFATGMCCIAKIIKLHLNRHPTIHQYAIFYLAAFECSISAIHWMLGKFYQLDFILQYLKLVQFLVVSHSYWTLASRVMRKDKLTPWLLLPLIAAFIYFSTVTLLGIVQIKSTWIECFQPEWLMLSTAEFIFVQLFMVAGFYISRRLNEISTLESVRWEQKRDLWSVIIVFELSAFAGLVYDATMQILGDKDEGCSAIFLHMQQIYSPIFGTFMLLKFIFPIWVMLCVFNPVELTNDHDDLLPAFSDEGTYTSVFSPSYPQGFKSLYQAGIDQCSPDGSDNPVWTGSPRAQLTPITEENTPSTSVESSVERNSTSIQNTHRVFRPVQV